MRHKILGLEGAAASDSLLSPCYSLLPPPPLPPAGRHVSSVPRWYGATVRPASGVQPAKAGMAEACYSRAPAEERQTGRPRERSPYAICEAAPTSPRWISPVARPKRRGRTSTPQSARDGPPNRNRARLRLPDRQRGSARVLERGIIYSFRPIPTILKDLDALGETTRVEQLSEGPR